MFTGKQGGTEVCLPDPGRQGGRFSLRVITKSWPHAQSSHYLPGLPPVLRALRTRGDRSFRMRKPPTRFPPELLSATSVGAASLADAAARCLLRLTRSGRFLLRRTAHRALHELLSATSIFALLAWSASHCSFRLTRSPRFRLRRMPHWGITRIAPPSTAWQCW